ncbi:MAG: hypothetical protein ACOVQX_07365 [Legionella sp.]
MGFAYRDITANKIESMADLSLSEQPACAYPTAMDDMIARVTKIVSTGYCNIKLWPHGIVSSLFALATRFKLTFFHQNHLDNLQPKFYGSDVVKALTILQEAGLLTPENRNAIASSNSLLSLEKALEILHKIKRLNQKKIDLIVRGKQSYSLISSLHAFNKPKEPLETMANLTAIANQVLLSINLLMANMHSFNQENYHLSNKQLFKINKKDSAHASIDKENNRLQDNTKQLQKSSYQLINQLLLVKKVQKTLTTEINTKSGYPASKEKTYAKSRLLLNHGLFANKIRKLEYNQKKSKKIQLKFSRL